MHICSYMERTSKSLFTLCRRGSTVDNCVHSTIWKRQCWGQGTGIYVDQRVGLMFDLPLDAPRIVYAAPYIYISSFARNSMCIHYTHNFNINLLSVTSGYTLCFQTKRIYEYYFSGYINQQIQTNETPIIISLFASEFTRSACNLRLAARVTFPQ